MIVLRCMVKYSSKSIAFCARTSKVMINFSLLMFTTRLPNQNVLVQRNTALLRVPRGIDDQPQVSSMTVVKHLVSFEKH